MMSRNLFAAVLALGLVIMSGTVSHALENPATATLPAGGVPLVVNATAALKPMFLNPDLGSASYRATDGVWELAMRRRSDNEWDNRLSLKAPSPIAKGQVLHFTFEAHTTLPFPATNYGEIRMVFKSMTKAPMDLSKKVNPASEWERYDFVTTAGLDYTPDITEVYLLYGFGPQQLELRNFAATVYPSGTPIESLPQTKYTYAGREEGAAWRLSARERIVQQRQLDLSVICTNARGRPQAGLRAELTLVKPEFGFGCAYLSRKGPMFRNKEENTRYYQEFYRLFNFATPEHELGAPTYSGPNGAEVAAAALATLGERGLPIYGHVLFWPMWRYQPFTKEEVERYQQDAPALKARILDQARIRLEATKGKVVAWNVVNEIQWQREMLDFLNKHGISDADMLESLLRLAREVDPQAKLIINEAGMFENNAMVSQIKRDYYLPLIAELKARGAPLDGFGFQSHFGAQPQPLTDIAATFDLFANLGLRLYITEFDIKSEDESLVADYTRDFYTLAYSHPAIDGITMWGFWSGAHFTPQGSLFRKDWSGRPVLAVYESLRKEWSTTLPNTVADKTGTVKFRGYPGDYDLSITSATGKKQTIRIKLSKENPAAAVTLQ